MSPQDNAPREAVAEFLYREAHLADAHAYDDWLGLWDHEALYHVPCNDDDADPELHVMLIYEQRRGLEDRIARLKSGFAHAQDPRSRLSRAVTNVRLSAREDDLLEVHSICQIVAFRQGRQDVYGARVVHVLRPWHVDFRIRCKTVYLTNNDGAINNLSFIV